MADEDVEEGGGKKSLLLLIVMVLLILVLLVGSIGGTLYFTGFFEKKEQLSAEAVLEQAKREAAAAVVAGKASDAGPKLQTKSAPEAVRYEHRYAEFEKELLANLTGSRKFMLVKVAVMTRYDDRVLKNVKKHEFALRSAALDIMRQTVEADLQKPDFRKLLAEKLRTEFNAVLEKLEDFGGIEEVYFTSFVVQ